jgi:hypothetical protein
MDVRSYDPALGRFNGIDPVVHYSQGTSVAFDNNPVFWADPSGADSIYNFDTQQYVINGKVVTEDEAMAYAKSGGNADGSNNNTSDEDCCGGADARVRSYTAEKMSKQDGSNYTDNYKELQKIEGDAAGIAAKEAVLLIAGEWATIKVFQAGKWIYRTVRTARLAKYSKRIGSIRNSLKIGKGRNIAYTEGSISGKAFSEVGVSGKALRNGTVGNPVNRLFSTSNVGGFSRAFDSEVKLLESFARQFSRNTSVKGVLKIVSERQFCGSCSNVVSQFQKMFPNVTVKIINGIK